MDYRNIGYGGMDWIDLVEDRGQWKALVNMVIKPSGSIQHWEIFE
jgi:hypothetical protein